MHGAHHVHVPHVPEYGGVRAREWAALDPARIIDENCNRTARLLGGCELPFDGGGICYIANLASGSVSARERLLQRSFGAPEHGHDSAGSGEGGGYRAPDAASAAGYEGM